MGARLLSVREFCERTSISLSSFNRYIRQGKIAFVRLGGRILVDEGEVVRLCSLCKPFGNDAPVVAVQGA
jgi:excisionase family DNA binding protein